jgi:hypothetical protein
LDETSAEGLEDRNEYGGLAGLYFDTSPRDRIGGEIAYDIYDLEETGKENVGLVSFVWNREIGRTVAMDLQVGLFHRDPASEVAAPDENDSGVHGLLRLMKTSRRTRTVFFLRNGPSAGGALLGTSTDTTARIAVEGEINPSWLWSLYAGYAKRDPTDSEQPDIDSTQAGAGLEWRPHQHLGFRLTLDHLERSGVEPEPDASAMTAMLGAVWYPKGPRRPVRSGE